MAPIFIFSNLCRAPKALETTLQNSRGKDMGMMAPSVPKSGRYLSEYKYLMCPSYGTLHLSDV